MDADIEIIRMSAMMGIMKIYAVFEGSEAVDNFHEQNLTHYMRMVKPEMLGGMKAVYNYSKDIADA